MQIFILNEHVEKNAQYYCDKHVIKIITEICQMLSTVYRIQNINVPDFIYKKTHINHPCVKWILEDLHNFLYTVNLGEELIKEYNYRFNKPENFKRAKMILEYCYFNIPNLKCEQLTPFAQAMPEQYKQKDAIKAYRDYYINEKSHLFKWTKRSKPSWINM